MSESLMSSASLHVRGYSVETDVNISIYPCTTSWTSGTAQPATSTLWNAYDEDYWAYSTASTSILTMLEFDVTEIFAYWADTPSAIAKGIMMITGNEGDSEDIDCYNQVMLYQTENTASDVYFSIDYSTLGNNFFINNTSNGHFLVNNGVSSNPTTSTYSTATDRVWNFTYVEEDTYYISPKNNATYGLYASGTSVRYGALTKTPPSTYKWKIIQTSSDVYTIQNVGTGYYLQGSASDTISLTSSLTSYTGWRFRATSNYVNLTSFSVNNVVFRLGDSGSYTITRANSATWSDSSDFKFSSASGFTINTNTRTVTSSTKGAVTITATHKPSGKTATFDVVAYRPAVFLIHGRTDNSITLWGASTAVWVDTTNTKNKANNHFNSSVTLTNDFFTIAYDYSQVYTQKIQSYYYNSATVPAVFNGDYTDDGYVVKHPEGGNLAYYLNQKGYEPNVDLFVFNYPNEDAVIHNATKLNAYLDNLAYSVRTSGTKLEKASLYGQISGLSASTPLNIHIVGHSMGGLVARYYIENLGKDENVEKLITIDTPHWGSGLADTSCITGALHELCDHDLRFDSRMYGGNITTSLSCNLNLLTCYNSDYRLTDELKYNAYRRTAYYAIAGLDYNAEELNSNDEYFEIDTNHSTFYDLTEELQLETDNKLYTYHYSDTIVTKVDIDVKSVGDNVVGFLSQIGWTENTGESPDKKITFERIFVNIDANGGNNIADHFHGKMPHREIVMEKVFEYITTRESN